QNKTDSAFYQASVSTLLNRQFDVQNNIQRMSGSSNLNWKTLAEQSVLPSDFELREKQGYLFEGHKVTPNGKSYNGVQDLVFEKEDKLKFILAEKVAKFAPSLNSSDDSISINKEARELRTRADEIAKQIDNHKISIIKATGDLLDLEEKNLSASNLSPERLKEARAQIERERADLQDELSVFNRTLVTRSDILNSQSWKALRDANEAEYDIKLKQSLLAEATAKVQKTRDDLSDFSKPGQKQGSLQDSIRADLQEREKLVAKIDSALKIAELKEKVLREKFTTIELRRSENELREKIPKEVEVGHSYLLNHWGADTLEGLSLIQFLSKLGIKDEIPNLKIADLRKMAEEGLQFTNDLGAFFKTSPEIKFTNWQDFKSRSPQILEALKKASALAPGTPLDVLGFNSKAGNTFQFKPTKDATRKISDFWNGGIGQLSYESPAIELRTKEFKPGGVSIEKEIQAFTIDLENRKKEIQKKLEAQQDGKPAPQLKSLELWTLPQLEALFSLVDRYGWDEKVLKPEPDGELLTLREKMQTFDPRDIGDSAQLLSGAQIIALRAPLASAIYGAKWEDSLGKENISHGSPSGEFLMNRFSRTGQVADALINYLNYMGDRYFTIADHSGIFLAPEFLNKPSQKRADLIDLLKSNRIITGSSDPDIKKAEDQTVLNLLAEVSPIAHERFQEQNGLARLHRLNAEEKKKNSKSLFGPEFEWVGQVGEKVIPKDELEKKTIDEDQKFAHEEEIKAAMQYDKVFRLPAPHLEASDSATKTHFGLSIKTEIVKAEEEFALQAAGAMEARILTQNAFFKNLFADPETDEGKFINRWFDLKTVINFGKEKRADRLGAESRAAIEMMGLPRTSGFDKIISDDNYAPQRDLLQQISKNFFDSGRALLDGVNRHREGGLTRDQLRQIVKKVMTDSKYRSLV
ncbi:MAG: hypothetical protein JWQ35_50, partial [Bacteriovoracaceae bacterium]|nr:hypothetical protein [Bacteriovoracaceae bacterium]